MEKEAELAGVSVTRTARGTARYVARAADGGGYPAFRDQLGEPGDTVPPEELHGKLKPFEEKAADDIERAKRDRE